MHTQRLATASFLVLCAVTSSPVAAADAMPPGSLRAQRVEFIDHRGFDRPMLAATMLVPAAWRTQAGVEWKFGVPCASPYHFRLFAQSPDQSSAIELLPGESWGMSSFGPPAGGCAQGGFGNPREYLQAWVQQHRPGARWLDYRARPDRSREVLNQPMAGGYFKSWIETGEALIGYTQNGREMRETLAVTISFAASRFNGVGGTPVQSLTGQSMGILAWRAPQGQLDFRQFEAVWQTLRRAPEWQSRIDAANQRMAQENADTQRRIGQIQAQMSRDTMNEIAKRGQIMAQTRADIAAIQNQTYNARDATTDRMQRDNVRTIREIETYREPRTGGVVELPNHYRHAWQLRDGSYFLTDSQAFDPVRDLGIGGDKLQVAR